MPMHQEIEAYMDQEGMHTVEGERGVRNFTKLVSALGYDSIEEFLADNSGAVTSMIEWIGNVGDDIWKEKLAGQLLVKPSDEDGEGE